MKWIIFLLFTSTLFASDYIGLVVTFKEKTNNKEKDRIHKLLNTKLSYRSGATRRDAVQIKKSNSALLQKKCQEYRVQKSIESCRLEKVARYNDCLTCRTPEIVPESLTTVFEILSKDSCSPFPAIYEGDNLQSDEFGKQSPFWAQEAIGAPEARAFMREQERPRTVSVGIIDGGFSKESLSSINISPEVRARLSEDLGPPSHGSPVSHLILGAEPYGISEVGQVTRIAPTFTDDPSASVSTSLRAFDQILGYAPDSPEDTPVNRSSMPEVINMSMTMGDIFQADIDKVAQNSLYVVSSGNEFATPQNESTATGFPKIVVGSLAPDGTVSSFSTTGDAVTITAPSDMNVQSHNGTEQVNFSGTSGAAPLVSGALTNAVSFLPGMTSKEAQILLKFSAIVTTGSPGPYPYTDGSGALNSYKLVRVAQKLQEGWPRNRHLISNWASYDFKSEAKEYYDRAQELLTNGADCVQKKQGLSLLRKAFFLDSDNKNYRSKLAELYRSFGHEAQARYVDHPSATRVIPEIANKTRERELIDLASNHRPENHSSTLQMMLRYLTPPNNQLPLEYNGKNIDWTMILTNNFSHADSAYNFRILRFFVDNGLALKPYWVIGTPPTTIKNWAVQKSDAKLLKYLVDTNEEIDLTDALIRVADRNEIDKIDMIINSGGSFDINRVTDWSNHSIFAEAILDNNLMLVRNLLRYNPDPNQLIHGGVSFSDGQYYQYQSNDPPVPLKIWIEQQDEGFNQLKEIIRALD